MVDRNWIADRLYARDTGNDRTFLRVSNNSDDDSSTGSGGRLRVQNSSSSDTSSRLFVQNPSQSDDLGENHERSRRVQLPGDFTVLILGTSTVGKTSVKEAIAGLAQGRITSEINVIEAQGLQAHTSEYDVSKILANALIPCGEGPHIVLWVMDASVQCSNNAYDMFRMIKRILEDDVTKYMMVAFTCEDKLALRGLNVVRMLDEQRRQDETAGGRPSEVRKILSAVDFRYVIFTKTADSAQKRSEFDHFLGKAERLMQMNGLAVRFPWHGFSTQQTVSKVREILLEEKDARGISVVEARANIERRLQQDNNQSGWIKAVGVGNAVEWAVSCIDCDVLTNAAEAAGHRANNEVTAAEEQSGSHGEQRERSIAGEMAAAVPASFKVSATAAGAVLRGGVDRICNGTVGGVVTGVLLLPAAPIAGLVAGGATVASWINPFKRRYRTQRV